MPLSRPITNQTERPEILVSIKNDKIKIATFAISVLAIIISGISVCITIYFAFPTKKEEVRVEYDNTLSIGSLDSVIYIGQYINFRNYGNISSTISNMEVFIVSISTDAQGNKHFKRDFSDVWYPVDNDNLNPLLGGYILYPYTSWTAYFSFYQKTFSDYPNRLEEGIYDYLVFYEIDNVRYLYSCYEFTINKAQSDSISKGKSIADINLRRIHDQKRIDNLLEIYNQSKQ